MKLYEKISIVPLLLLIKFYQQAVSPWLGPSCRYTPSCSEYAAAALRSHGFFGGIRLSLRRIMRCHPWGGEGYDPAPANKKKIE